ncbi:MAG TPA: pyridoxamine 5'-phosphate oxidase family protein [Nevskiales bacterium]|nr:pyridoxamine 5'-phosphate oxidase family protein [Nevskiales bacterium]
MPSVTEFRLDAELAGFVTGGVTVIAASRDAGNCPNLVRARGCRVSPDGRRVTVFLDGPQSTSLLADWRANGRVAVVFTRPSTHRSVQLKGRDAAIEPLAEGDHAIVARYRDLLAEELATIGYGHGFTAALLAADHDALVALSFTPEAAFSQTPGPGAGAPLTR